MKSLPSRVFQQWRRAWYRWRGERVVLITFWPGDYRLGDDHTVAGRRYRITRYVRATQQDTRFFEVWGQALDAASAIPSSVLVQTDTVRP